MPAANVHPPAAPHRAAPAGETPNRGTVTP
ncbi:unannotated protein [freshwater metagenome]|uniref:Unannotated protein n=1 Tax=freshwater metagenome TaxID=449393 RepID=A0A6J7GAN0_9ZZZZ